ncbi:MAG: malate dehydrogenase [Deltaproteobacteria bacterium]|nr:malate dehydrogenase [Deltaproteobacteria bacterium]
MTRKKVTVVGGGFVGSTTAQRIVERELADVVLMDIVEDMPQGKSLDMAESAPCIGFDSAIIGANDYSMTANSDIVVITAGLPRKPGMTRDDLLQKNAEIVGSVVDNVAKYSPNAILLLVSNPLDVMTYHAWKRSGFPMKRVFGMAGVLDSARYRTFIAMELDVSVKDVQAMVLGGHGDTMVPLPRYSTVAGIPITELISAERIAAINERTTRGGEEIVKLLKTGSAYYATSAAVLDMVESILLDQRRILPCCVHMNGEYGLRDVYCGVPVKLDHEGVAEIVELKLSSDELAMLHRSAEAVRENVKKLNY